MLRLEEYTTSLKQQKYVSVEQMTQLTWEDLEDIGITKLGHQKKVHHFHVLFYCNVSRYKGSQSSIVEITFAY